MAHARCVATSSDGRRDSSLSTLKDTMAALSLCHTPITYR